MTITKAFVTDIRNILAQARRATYAYVNQQMLEAYWKVGERIVLEEQKGKKRAHYGSFLIQELSIKLLQEFGKGFDQREIRRMRQFYQYFPIWGAVRPELTWTHYRYLLRVDKAEIRTYYITEAIAGGWNTRQLERNIQSQYYFRLVAHQKSTAIAPSSTSTTPLVPSDFIKDPYCLEFLGIDHHTRYSENDLETAVLHQLQQFLLEMGRGFAFVARQYHIRTATKEFYIDLVFYNYYLKCFVLIDLKISTLTHQDIGQMDMYVRLFEDVKKTEGDNPTVGIILCSDKDETIVKYSVLQENKQLFASQYRLYLPNERELIAEIEREKSRIASKA